MRLSISCRSVIICDLIEKFIEYSGFHTLSALYLDLLSMFEDEIDTFPFYRLSEDDRSIGKEVELLREVLHIPVHDRFFSDIWLREDFVPLIQDEDDTLFFLHRLTDDMLILMRNPLERIHDDSDDISSFYRALSPEYTPLFDISTSDLSGSADTSSIYETELFSLKFDDRIDRISSRSWHILHDRADSTRYSID